MSEDQLARDRVQQKLTQELARKRKSVVQDKVSSIRLELERALERNEQDLRQTSPLQTSPAKTQQQVVQDVEMLRLLQMRQQQAAKQTDLLRLQLNEAQRTVLDLKELLEKERARSRQLQVQFIHREKQQLGDQKSEFQVRIRQNLKIIEQLQGQRRQLTELLELAQGELVAQRERGRRAAEAQQEQFKRELKANKEAWVSMQNEKKKKWRSEQEAKIKEATIRGMQPEVERIIRTSRDEVKAVREESQRKILELKEELAVDFENRTRRLKDEAFAECQALIQQERKEAMMRQRTQYQQLARVGEEEKAALRAQYDRQLRELQDQRKKESDYYIERLNKAHEQNLAEQKKVRAELQARLGSQQGERDQALAAERERAAKERQQLEARVRAQFSKQFKEKLQKALVKMAAQRDEKIGVIIERMAKERMEYETGLRRECEQKIREERKSREEAEKRAGKEAVLMQLKLKEHKDQLAQQRALRQLAEEKAGTVLRQMQSRIDKQISRAREGLEDRMVEVRLRAGQEAELKYLNQVQQLTKQVAQLKAQAEKERKQFSAKEQEREREAESMEREWVGQVQELQRGFKKVIKKKEEEAGRLAEELRNAAQKVRTYEGLLEKQRADLMSTLR